MNFDKFSDTAPLIRKKRFTIIDKPILLQIQSNPYISGQLSKSPNYFQLNTIGKTPINPLSLKSDQREISSYNINALENRVVMRTEYMMREDESN